MVTNAFASVTLGLAICLLLQGRLSPINTAPGLGVALFHLVSITTMRVLFFARLTKAHSVLRALTSRVSVEVAWLSLLCAMWLTDGILLRRVFLLYVLSIYARGLDSNGPL